VCDGYWRIHGRGDSRERLSLLARPAGTRELGFPHLQILASSHSPYLLDFLQPDQVRLLSLDASGHAICGRLADHPEFEKWKDEMAPGEMWSLFGEKWLAEGGGPK
jgi:hypothetical protein